MPHSDLPAYAIEIEDLSKTYSHAGGKMVKRALDSVSLKIPRGAFFGLLGPNGAGKSTLINILAGLVRKTSGKAQVWGRDIDAEPLAAKAAIGVVPQELNLDPFFTPRELLEVQAGMYGVPPHERRTDAILEALGLADKAHAYARTLSGGMRRRLLVAKAMVHRPPILVLDEPTAGVDVELRRQLWTFIRSLNAQGTTVLLTTHYLEEAEQLCDTIAIIHRGSLAACEPTRRLLQRIDGKTLNLLVNETVSETPAALAAFTPEITPRPEGGSRITIRFRPSESPIGAIMAAIAASGLTLADLSTEETDLEDIFLQITRALPQEPADAGRPQA